MQIGPVFIKNWIKVLFASTVVFSLQKQSSKQNVQLTWHISLFKLDDFLQVMLGFQLLIAS